MLKSTNDLPRVPISHGSPKMEQIRPELHLLWGKAAQAAWHTEHPERPNPETSNQSFDRLGEAGPQRRQDQKPVEVWALDKTKTI
jgi:hypothetical protein